MGELWPYRGKVCVIACPACPGAELAATPAADLRVVGFRVQMYQPEILLNQYALLRQNAGNPARQPLRHAALIEEKRLPHVLTNFPEPLTVYEKCSRAFVSLEASVRQNA